MRKTVSQMLGWLREFLPVPERHQHGQSESCSGPKCPSTTSSRVSKTPSEVEVGRGSDAAELGSSLLYSCSAAPAPSEPTSLSTSGLTEEGEVGGEDEEHSVAAHGEGEREVSRQTAPGEEVVDRRPVMGVQEQLEDGGASNHPHVHARRLFLVTSTRKRCRSHAHSPVW